jgi:hypothetical protein
MSLSLDRFFRLGVTVDLGVLQRLHIGNEARAELLVPFGIVALRELFGRRIEEKGILHGLVLSAVERINRRSDQ